MASLLLSYESISAQAKENHYMNLHEHSLLVAAANSNIHLIGWSCHIATGKTKSGSSNSSATSSVYPTNAYWTTA